MGAPRIDRLDKNYLINGNFDFWQRATSFANTGSNSAYGSADRWYNWSGTPGHNVTFSRVAGDKAQWAMRVQRNAGNAVSNNAQIAQTVEIAFGREMAGKRIALVFRARCGANYSPTGSLMVSTIDHGIGSVDQNIITAGMVGIVTTNQNNVLTTTYQDFIQFVDVPAGRTQFAVRFRMDTVGTAGANDWFEIEQVGLIVSSIQPEEFSRAARTYAEELALCQRYFQKSDDLEVAPGSAGALNRFYTGILNGGGGGAHGPIVFVVPLRATPIMSYWNGTVINNAFWRRPSSDGSNTITFNNLNTYGTDPVNNTVGPAWAVSQLAFNWSADAEI